MSITAALANAYSGLAASSRTAETISNNVANAMTEGYSRKTAVLSANSVNGVGAGVRFDGLERAADPRATADRRRLDAEAGESSVLAEARGRVAAAWGNPGVESSLPARAAALEIALRTLADSPESTALQGQAVTAAKEVTRTIQNISTETARIRVDADAAINRQVSIVNDSLKQIELLNREIQIRNASGGDFTALEDERQRLIDRVSSLIPIKTYPRGNGQLAIYGKGGGALLDGKAFELEFSPTGTISQDMTLESGALSGLTLNGVEIEIGRGGGLLDGGALSANFEIRDVIGVAEGARIDAFAMDLIMRFQDPAADPTQSAGDPGLFTLNGLAADPADPEGAALQISLNAAVDPVAGGAAWRLRDGVGAVSQGPAGDDSILRNLLDAMADRRAPAAEAGLGGSYGISDLSAELAATTAENAASATEIDGSRMAQLEVAATAEAAATGVDTDQELAALMLVEQAYAANARVLQVVDALLERLMEI